MLDLGASINVMPMHVFRELELNNFQKTDISILLVDRSYVIPLGIVEDVLIKVGELIFPVDFYTVFKLFGRLRVTNLHLSNVRSF